MMYAFYVHYKGQQISFPTKLFSKDFIKKSILNEFDGSNYSELAKKFNYSERWIREILKCKEK